MIFIFIYIHKLYRYESTTTSKQFVVFDFYLCLLKFRLYRNGWTWKFCIESFLIHLKFISSPTHNILCTKPTFCLFCVVSFLKCILYYLLALGSLHYIQFFLPSSFCIHFKFNQKNGFIKKYQLLFSVSLIIYRSLRTRETRN